MNIRPATPADHAAVWQIFHEVVAAGDSYPYPPDTTREQALRLWIEQPTATYVAELNGEIVGTYYIAPNKPGLADHVCNCGYMVAQSARGHGVATAMCQHSQTEALRLGFKAMQFNLVVATNEASLHLWKKLRFQHIGILPKAFRHQTHGFVDAHIFYKWLKPDDPTKSE